MTAVTRSASINITQVLNAVGAAATALTTTVNSLNHAANTLATHTSAWAERSSAQVKRETTNFIVTLDDRMALDLAERLHETETRLSKNAELRKFYDKALEIYAKADGRTQEAA